MITTFTGENSFLLQRDLRERIQQFVTEQSDIALERIDGEDASFDRMRESLQSLPFLASKKMVVLRSPGSNKEFTEHLEGLSAELPDSTEVLIVEPKLDKRLAYYKFLKKSTDFKEYPQLDARGLSKFVQDEALRLHGAISASDANYLVERIGLDQEYLAQEVKKLCLFNDTITRTIIDELTDASLQSKIFDLIDASFAGNTQRALQLYGEQRQQKVEPQAIIGMLVWQLHILAIVAYAGNMAASEIARTAKISPYVTTKSQAIVRRMSQAQVKDLLARLAELDFVSKTKTYDLDEALQNYIVTIL